MQKQEGKHRSSRSGLQASAGRLCHPLQEQERAVRLSLGWIKLMWEAARMRDAGRGEHSGCTDVSRRPWSPEQNHLCVTSIITTVNKHHHH